MKAKLQRTIDVIGRPFVFPGRGVLQHKCACGGTLGPTGECEACRKGKLQLPFENLRASSANRPLSISKVPPIVHEVLRSPGHPLDTTTRNVMEPFFGHDFSHVRVHTDAEAADSAGKVSAVAYTVGRNVVFGAGQYAPTTREGRKLLAHELTHVLQQQKGSSFQRQAFDVSDADSSLEEEQNAEEVAEAMEENEFVHDRGLRLFRQSKSKGATTKKKKKKKKKARPISTKLTADEVKTLISNNNKSTLSPELLLCQIWKESTFNPSEKTGTHLGLLQINKEAVTQVNKSTPRGVHYNYGDMTDAAKNIQCGTLYLGIRIEWAKGDVTKGLEGFGTGTGYATNIQTCEACIKKDSTKTGECLKAIHP